MLRKIVRDNESEFIVFVHTNNSTSEKTICTSIIVIILDGCWKQWICLHIYCGQDVGVRTVLTHIGWRRYVYANWNAETQHLPTNCKVSRFWVRLESLWRALVRARCLSINERFSRVSSVPISSGGISIKAGCKIQPVWMHRTLESLANSCAEDDWVLNT